MSRQAHDELIREIWRRYPDIARWAFEQPYGYGLGLVIMKPANVMDEHHRIVHDAEFRERARPIIAAVDSNRVNELGPNAVLVLVPLQ